MENEETVTFSITLPKKVHDFLVKKGKKEFQLRRASFIRHILISYMEEKKNQKQIEK